MQKKGWSQRTLAKKLGIHFSYFSHISSGRKRPSLNTAMGISKALGMTLEQFYRLITV